MTTFPSKVSVEPFQTKRSTRLPSSGTFAFTFVSRETVDGEPLIVVDLTPRPNAVVKTSEGERMKRFAGRLWAGERD